MLKPKPDVWSRRKSIGNALDRGAVRDPRHFSVLAYGLWRLQVMQSGYYASAAEKTAFRNVPILAPAGRFWTAKGASSSTTTIVLGAGVARTSRDLNVDADLIAQGLHLDADDVRTRIRHFRCHAAVSADLLKEDITRTSRPSSKRIATNCRNWIRSGPTGDCIRAMVSWRT